MKVNAAPIKPGLMSPTKANIETSMYDLKTVCYIHTLMAKENCLTIASAHGKLFIRIFDIFCSIQMLRVYMIRFGFIW